MIPILKRISLSLITVLITYFGFIHNIEILQGLIGAVYVLAAICLPLVLLFLYIDHEEAHTLRNTIKSTYKAHDFIISLFVIPSTCWIFYTSSSYNFLASYIILAILMFVLHYRIYTIIKTR